MGTDLVMSRGSSLWKVGMLVHETCQQSKQILTHLHTITVHQCTVHDPLYSEPAAAGNCKLKREYTVQRHVLTGNSNLLESS